MRRAKKKMTAALLAAALVIAGVSPAQAAKASLKDRLKGATDEAIREFYAADLNGDGKKEAVAVTSKTTNEYGWYEDAKVWYVSDTGCDAFYDSEGDYLYGDTWKLYPLKGTRMLCYDAGAGGSGYTSFAWVFDKKGPRAVENAMSGVRQLKGNEFVILDSRYDGCTDDTGHTHNQYFARWDGEKLVEYGGLKISVAQLKKAEHASRILKDVKKYGKIKSIYYRANGLIFLNLQDDALNRNVALSLKDGKLSYYDYGNGGTGEESALEKATADGIIHKSITGCVKYPKQFPPDKKKGQR